MSAGEPSWWYKTSENSIYRNTDISGDVNFQKLKNRVEEIEKRLCILDANPDALSKFESLKNAYNEYKLIEKLVYGELNETSK